MEISNDNQVLWFAYDWEDGIRYFKTQAEAIAWVQSQIPLYFDDDDREWNSDVKILSVGCLTHTVKSFPHQDREYCDHRLVQVQSEDLD